MHGEVKGTMRSINRMAAGAWSGGGMASRFLRCSRGWVSGLLWGLLLLAVADCQAQQEREWTDASGKFKITASLVEVRDGNAFLKTTQGKTVKIPVSRLSSADQKFLEGGANPFEVVDGESMDDAGSEGVPATPPETNSGGMPWSGNWSVDWDQVPELDRGFGTEWSYQPTGPNELDFEAKRATVPGKANFFEGMRRLKINPVAKRAVAGYTLTFSVPKHQSRISLLDLASGKSINTDLVDSCNMCPLMLLNDGTTIVMQGTGDQRDGYETNDQLQLWRVRGKQAVRSPTWVPFPEDQKSFGKTVNGALTGGWSIGSNRILLLTGEGHLACFDVVSREPIWHSRLGKNHAVELSVDQQTLFVMSGRNLMVVEPQSGKVTSSLVLEDEPHMAWTKICLSPAGDKLLLSFTSQLRMIDLASGEVELIHESGGGPLAPNGLLFPHPDYALLNNHLLLHLPSRILVCDYQQAAVIKSLGGVEFVGVMDDQRGVVVPTQIPHPKAEELLKQAQDDPSVFLIHPGVSVAVDVSGVPANYRKEAEDGLTKAAREAGYQIQPNASIRLKATISGPKQRAVSYIASGSYVANEYTSKVDLMSGSEVVWSRQGTNVPGVIQTERGQSIQEKLDELGRQPYVGFFGRVGLPKLLQQPQGGQNGNGANALLVARFSTSGLQDSN